MPSDVLALWGENEVVSSEDDHQAIAAAVNSVRPGKGPYVRVAQSDHAFTLTTSPADSLAKGESQAPASTPTCCPSSMAGCSSSSSSR
jgi:hypothetical protein